MINFAELTRNNIITITNAMANDSLGHRCIVPQFSRGYSNTIVNNGSGEYDGGERVIGLFGCFDVDGDLLITTGWGDGTAIRRLNNDGTLTKIWHETNSLYRDTTSVYNHINSMAIHRGSSQIALSTHNVNGYSMIDYSDIKDTSTTTNNVVNDRPSSRFIFSTGANIDRTGSYYNSGTVTAGDWLYILDYDATHYKKYPRRHWTNGTEQLLDGTSSTYMYSGSSAVDRNGYRGQLHYDEVNDRVYYNYYYNANFTVILDASTANPKTLWVDLGDAGAGDDGWEQGLYIPDPINYPNKVYIGGSSSITYVDYTNCFTGGTASVLDRIYTGSTNSNAPNNYPTLFRHGNKWHGETATYKDRLVDGHCPVHADRGYARNGGWIDMDNGVIVALYNHSNITEDTSGGRGRSIRHDYGQPVFSMQSANGTEYLIQTGYSYDGHRFLIWPASVGAGLKGNWLIEYGTFTATENIDFVSLNTREHFVPSGCSLTKYVSNDNGSTWETYNEGSDDIHTFSSTGTQLRVKYVATGNAAKAPYKMSSGYDGVLYGSLHTSVKNPSIPMKVSRARLRGKK